MITFPVSDMDAFTVIFRLYPGRESSWCDESYWFSHHAELFVVVLKRRGFHGALNLFTEALLIMHMFPVMFMFPGFLLQDEIQILEEMFTLNPASLPNGEHRSAQIS